MIVLEGPDLIGKTTLAHSIVKELSTDFCGHFYGHLANWPKESSRKTFYRHLVSLVNPYVVLDRFHLSEMVYGNFYRKNTRLSHADLWMLDGKIRQAPGIVIVMTGSEQLLEQRHTIQRITHSRTPLVCGGESREPTLDEVLMLNKAYIDLVGRTYVHEWLHLEKDTTPNHLIELPQIREILHNYKLLMEAYRRIYND